MAALPSSALVLQWLDCAARAPSSHNTQPWRFRVGPDFVELLADRRRSLRVVDPEDRELVISCGASLLHLCVAAAHGGAGADVTLLPRPADPDCLAIVRWNVVPPDAELGALFAAIAGRRTYRRRFAAAEVPTGAQRALAAAAAAHGAWLHVVTGDAERRAVASLVAEGDTTQWRDPAFRRELAAWLHPATAGDGLVVPGLVAPLAQFVVRTFDIGRRVAAKDHGLAQGSPLLVVLGTAGDGPRDWLEAGQSLARLLLVAGTHGLQASYLNQPVEVPALRDKLRARCGRLGHPQLLLRLGVPQGSVAPAPRRPLHEVVEQA